KAAQNLRDEQLHAAPVAGDETEAPHRDAEAGEPEHHQPARIELARQKNIDRNAGERSDAGREDRDSGLPCAVTSHVTEKYRRQVDRSEYPDAGDEGQRAADREIAIAKSAQIDDGVG